MVSKIFCAMCINKNASTEEIIDSAAVMIFREKTFSRCSKIFYNIQNILLMKFYYIYNFIENRMQHRCFSRCF